MSAIRIATIILLAGVLVNAHFALGKQAEWSGLFTLQDVLLYTNRILPNTVIPIRLPLTGVSAIDNYFAFMTAFFWGTLDPRNVRAHLQGNYLVGTLGSIWILMLVEAHRGRRSRTFLALTYIFEFFGELLGIGMFTPIWCIFNLLLISQSTIRRAPSTPDKSLGPLGYAILFGHIMPTYLMIRTRPDGVAFSSQQWWSVIRLFHPFLVFAMWQILQGLQTIFKSSSTTVDRSEDSSPGVRKFYIFSILVSGWFHVSSLAILFAPYLLSGWLHENVTAALDIKTVLVPVLFWNSETAVYTASNPVPFRTGVAIFLQWDNLCAASAIVIWAASLYLENAGARTASNAGTIVNTLLQSFLVGLLAGPGASAAYLLMERDAAIPLSAYSQTGDRKTK